MVILLYLLLLFEVMLVPFGVLLEQWWPLGVPKEPKAPQSQIFVTFWAPLGSPRGALLRSFRPQISKSEGLCWLFGVLFLDSEKEPKRSSPGGGDMRSAHAGACFVRVGPRRVGSILGSILEAFWEPSSPLYSLWVALVAKRGTQKRGQNIVEKKAVKSHAG